MHRDDDRPENPYLAPGIDTEKEAPAPPQQPPSVGKVVVVTLLLVVGLPIAALVLLFAICTAFVALA